MRDVNFIANVLCDRRVYRRIDGDNMDSLRRGDGKSREKEDGEEWTHGMYPEDSARSTVLAVLQEAISGREVR